MITTLSLNAASIAPDDIGKRRIDRDDEVREILQALGPLEQNVLLIGSRSVGKTFLVRLIEAQMRKSGGGTFPCVANVANVSLCSAGVLGSDDTSGFLRAILLQLCSSLWKFVGGHYLDLRERLLKPPGTTREETSEMSKICRVYSQLMRIEATLTDVSAQSLGVGAGIRGELKGELSSGTRNLNVLPFEFAEFVDELTVGVLHAHGFRRIVFLCDEANVMPLFRQEQLLEQYLDLFRSKGGQFLFVAGMLAGDDNLVLPACFERVIHLTGFKKRQDVCDLLRQAGEAGSEIKSEAVDAFFQAYSGHPRRTLMAADLALKLFPHAPITAASALQACASLDRQMATEARQLPLPPKSER